MEQRGGINFRSFSAWRGLWPTVEYYRLNRTIKVGKKNTRYVYLTICCMLIGKLNWNFNGLIIITVQFLFRRYPRLFEVH